MYECVLQVETYLSSELRNLSTTKENLDMEVHNIKNNCDLVENYINDDMTWDDAELMETKEVFVKTVDFVRNFEHEAGCNERDYNRKVRLNINQDPNHLQACVQNLGEINIHSLQIGNNSSFNTQGTSASGISRSKSDHRLAVQFRENERFGSDNDTSSTRRRADGYGDDDHSVTGSGVRRNRYKSRFHRTGHLQDPDSDTDSTGLRGDRPVSPTVPREKVLDTDDAIRGPISGIARLWDAPRVLLKLTEGELKKDKKTTQALPQQPVVPAPIVQTAQVQQTPQQPVPPKAGRQVSEEDEIAKQKRLNKEWAANQPGGATATVPSAKDTTVPTTRRDSNAGRTSAPSSRPASRQSSVRDEATTAPPTRRVTTGSRSMSTDQPDSTAHRRQASVGSANSGNGVSRQESTEESPAVAPWRMNSLRGGSSITEERQRPVDDCDDDSNGRRNKSSVSSTTPSTAASSARRTSGELMLRSRRTSSESTSSSSSRSSSPPKTGAAFPTSTIRQRYEAPSPTSTPKTSALSTYRSRVRASEPPVTATPTLSTGTRSRFLGHRSADPTLKGSASTDESSDSETEAPARRSSTATSSGVLKPHEQRSDIGPLLARSAHARNNPTYKSEPEQPVSSYARSRTAANLYRGTSFEDTEPSSSYRSSGSGTSGYRARRYGRYDAPETDLYTTPDRYSSSSTGLASKYYNRSRGNLYDDYPSRSGSSYSSRYLNRSKSSAALDGPEADEEQFQHGRPSTFAHEDQFEEPERRKTWGTRSSSSFKDDDGNNNTASQDHTNSSSSKQGAEGGIEPVEGESHLSSWARYLKSKYGNRSVYKILFNFFYCLKMYVSRYKETSRLLKSRSYGSFGKEGDTSDESEEELESRAQKSPEIDMNNPRSQYLKKRKVSVKIIDLVLDIRTQKFLNLEIRKV